jgi:hypothetical protein
MSLRVGGEQVLKEATVEKHNMYGWEENQWKIESDLV